MRPCRLPVPDRRSNEARAVDSDPVRNRLPGRADGIDRRSPARKPTAARHPASDEPRKCRAAFPETQEYLGVKTTKGTERTQKAQKNPFCAICVRFPFQ